MSGRKVARPFVPNRLLVRRARRAWETLASSAAVSQTCDARRCAKLAKGRKQTYRAERRAVRQLMKDAVSP